MKYIYSIIFLLLLVGCNNKSQLVVTLPIQTIKIESPSGERYEIMAEIADEMDEYAQGLMYRKALEEGTGMMFSFPEEKPRSFWMKNTIIPLDIIFFDGEGKYVSSVSMDPCFEEPCRHYFSARETQFALELNKGEVSRMGVGEGWKLGK